MVGELRYYQREAVDATYQFLGSHTGRNPCVVLPTGAGKTHVIAQFCRDVISWGGRVLVLAHVKELLEQADEKLTLAGLKPSVYSASLKRREKDGAVVVAGIQSVYKRGLDLAGTQGFSVVVVDEAHRIPTEGNGMYVQLLDDLIAANPKLRVIGLTATPYRTGEGYVCSDDHFLHEICYEAQIGKLIEDGFLCPLVSKRGQAEADLSGVRMARGDYNAAEMEERFIDSDVVGPAVNEMLELCESRKKVLVFCCGIAHASTVAYMIEAAGESVRLVTSEHDDRSGSIAAFKEGRCKYLVNVNVLTEGFDATALDAVVLLRATTSPGLYYQMVGRGLRIDPSKQDCLVLDYGGNVRRHGPIDNLQISKAGKATEGDAPVKECPECNTMIHAGLLQCSECGHEFPKPEANHEETADEISVIGATLAPEEWEVDSVGYAVHTKRDNPDAPKTLRVTYYDNMLRSIVDEWVCVEHSGFAYQKALDWWRRRTDAVMPATAEEAVVVANAGGLAEPTKVTIKREVGKPWAKVVGYELGPAKATEGMVFEDEEVPW